MRPRGVGGLRRAFVGRERELDALQVSFHRVLDEAQPRLVTILGDVGVGKTTLVRELWEWLGTQAPEPLRRVGRCLSYGEGSRTCPSVRSFASTGPARAIRPRRCGAVSGDTRSWA